MHIQSNGSLRSCLQTFKAPRGQTRLGMVAAAKSSEKVVVVRNCMGVNCEITDSKAVKLRE